MRSGQRRICTGALRRLCVTTASALTVTHRRLSTEEIVSEEQQWTAAMADKYGAGNYQLFRPLYKDLCDEIRREYYTKPPPPPPVARTRRGRPTTEAREEVQVREDGADGATGAPDGAASPLPVQPETTFGDGSWSVDFRPADNVVAFHRAAVKEGRVGEVFAWSRVELKDPPRLNAVLMFADWIPMEVCVVRNGVVLHFSMASNEGGMHMRNVRVYEPASQEELAALVDPSDDGEYARKKFYYDGPCLWHLELDFQNELYDVMQDHEISLDWVQWAATWVFYLEHVSYVKWNVGLLEELIPTPARGPESDFLTAAEKALLDEPVEDWLEAHSK